MPILTDSVNQEFNRRVFRLGVALIDAKREVESLAMLYAGYDIPNNAEYTPPTHMSLAEMNAIFAVMGSFKDLLVGTAGGVAIPNDATRDDKLEILISGG